MKRYPVSVKLCRFELKSEPGTIRSGMVYDGKIYETDGTEAIGVHEAADVRPLAPVPTPPSIRVFRTDLSDSGFVYANPAAVIGPSMVIELPDTATNFVVRSYLGAVIGGAGYQLDEEEAESVLLGFTLVNILSSNSIEEDDGKCVGRCQDFGIMVGPVITTPDDLDDAMTPTDNGIMYKLSASIRVNGDEKGFANFEEFSLSMVDAVKLASETCTVRSGDLLCVGPMFEDSACAVSKGDEFQFSMERLGMLSTKLG